MLKNYIVIIGLISVAGILGFISGNYFGKNKKIKIPINSTVTESVEKNEEFRLGGFKFINPLLDCENYHQSSVFSTVVLEKDIQKFIDKSISSGRAAHIAFYYRDLNNGPWIGIGVRENYSPASLLKVPIMIAAFKKSESEPGFLKKKIRFNKGVNDGMRPNITDSTIAIGKTYSVERLIYFMIVHSDNNARLLLFQNIEPIYINRVFSDVGIDMANFNDTANFMSVKTYSSFFRILYNATYLNRENSEQALQILTNSSFNHGIPAQLPATVPIAHKFGERGYINSDIVQLHDCGIVYKGNSPYLICIMTQGTNTTELEKIIAEISLMVYLHN